ncbi:MAG: hypothetical protein GY820_14175 [Gammaproteobacteria bacterium]|nr:hypothetical protein [Gammaproteobacteria bacterium]
MAALAFFKELLTAHPTVYKTPQSIKRSKTYREKYVFLVKILLGNSKISIFLENALEIEVMHWDIFCRAPHCASNGVQIVVIQRCWVEKRPKMPILLFSSDGFWQNFTPLHQNFLKLFSSHKDP